MIYCVVPQELASQLYDKLVDYYADDDNVKVIVDRRGPGSRRQDSPEGGGNRTTRDRRRQRVPGEFPKI
jgi:hypothetical protein